MRLQPAGGSCIKQERNIGEGGSPSRPGPLLLSLTSESHEYNRYPPGPPGLHADPEGFV